MHPDVEASLELIRAERLLIYHQDQSAAVKRSIIHRPGDGELELFEELIVAYQKRALGERSEEAGLEGDYLRDVRAGDLGEEHVASYISNHPAFDR